MAAPHRSAKRVLERILGDADPERRAEALRPRLPEEEPLPPRLPGGNDLTQEGLEKRRRFLRERGIRIEQLAGRGPEIDPAGLAGNIEDHIGFARIPVGIIGPLRINGTCARGDFYVPLATTEGALVASYQRGAHVVSLAGGVAAACLTESVARAPCFVFRSFAQAGRFLAWLLPRVDGLQETVARTSRHARLADLRTTVTGKEVYLLFEFTTGDAAGQNMVTIASEAICRRLQAESPVKPERWYLEANMSGDKKATTLAFTYARGKKVIAEAVVPRRLIRRFIRVEPQDMVRYWETSILGGIQSGSIGVQGHYANALAALFIACGQDAACVSEASVGLTRLDVTGEGDLYVSVSLPGLIVGTVGGGTHLPTASECLDMIGCRGEGHGRTFAEICGAVALAGEVSIVGSLAAGDFAKAHAAYGRRSGRK